jgi:hypothetical protein
LRILAALPVLLLVLTPQARVSRETVAAKRAWPSFIAEFHRAVKKRDRVSLKKMMLPDFDFSEAGGDGDGDGDTRDEAFQFWDETETGAWDAFDKILSRGAVPMSSWWDGGRKRETPGRVSPPATNKRRNITSGHIEWYAVFEFRGGRWYCVIFKPCCE